MDVAPRGEDGFSFSPQDTSQGTPQMAVLRERVDIMGEVDTVETGFRKGFVQQFKQQACMFVQQRDLHAATMSQNGVSGKETIVFVPLGVEGLFGTGDEEKGVIHDIRPDDRFTFRRMLHHHLSQIR